VASGERASLAETKSACVEIGMEDGVAYREENDEVILTMSREDYERLLMAMGEYAVRAAENRSILSFSATIRLMNRLNQGNPNYTPYQVGEKKS
jgi:hypothetical protein